MKIYEAPHMKIYEAPHMNFGEAARRAVPGSTRSAGQRREASGSARSTEQQYFNSI